jgi:hypothetical protein
MGKKKKKHVQFPHYLNGGAKYSALIGQPISRCLKTINIKSAGYFKTSIKSIIAFNLDI